MMNRIMFASEQLMAAKSAVSRIEAILQEKPLKESNTQKQPKDASVVFEDVSFTYPGAKKKALYHVSFEVPDGKKIALVGASGSGKSTAASLIPRFYDVQEGDVLVGGVDVREIAKMTSWIRLHLCSRTPVFSMIPYLKILELPGQMPHVKK